MINKYSKISFIFLVLLMQTFAALLSQASETDILKKELVKGLLPEMNIFKQRERFELLAPFFAQNTWGLKSNLQC